MFSSARMLSLPFIIPDLSLESVFSCPLCSLGKWSQGASWVPWGSGMSPAMLQLCDDSGKGICPEGHWMSVWSLSSCFLLQQPQLHWENERLLFKGESDKNCHKACCQEVRDRCSSTLNRLLGSMKYWTSGVLLPKADTLRYFHSAVQQNRSRVLNPCPLQLVGPDIA